MIAQQDNLADHRPGAALVWHDRAGGSAVRAAGLDHDLLRLGADAPALTLGRGTADVVMVRGNFALTDRGDAAVALGHVMADPGDPAARLLAAAPGAAPLLRLTLAGHRLCLTLLSGDWNRVELAVPAHGGEHIYGGGEQMSYLALNQTPDARRFPLWTSEPGVGRDKSRDLTRIMDAEGMAGGDYWTTNYPQPTWLSSAGYALHLDSRAYAEFDFTDPAQHRIVCWEVPPGIEFFVASDMAHWPRDLVGQLADRFGPPAADRRPLPAWATGGTIVGLKDGANSFARLAAIRAAGVPVAALWCEDWCGVRETSFGRRLMWDWRWNAARHPELPARMAELAADGIGFMGYVNPYLAADGPLFAEAAAAGHLALHPARDVPYLVDFGEFDAGVVDFTSAAAAAWFADRVIGREMLDFGLCGWMADFGEYLPTDVRLADGSDPMLRHNHWPVLWAAANQAAVAQRGRDGAILWFMRAGHSDLPRHCPLLWAGDQCVDFSRHDGLGTVITAALSAGLVGNAWHHGDCGGYTSLHGLVRTPELLMRWAELAAFAPVLRTHEGNRPGDNLQYDSSPELLAHFALMAQLHAALAPYVRAVEAEAVAHGWPLQRAMFFEFPGDADCRTLHDQFCYGADLLVAPVVSAGAASRRVYLPPAARWLDFYTGAAQPPGWHEVAAPPGLPPAYVRADGAAAALLAAIGAGHHGRWQQWRTGGGKA